MTLFLIVFVFSTALWCIAYFTGYRAGRRSVRPRS
jgi:hypothetical protein